MTAVTFDTLAAVKRLREAGLDQQTAEAVVSEISAAQLELFTKRDAEAFKAELKLMVATSAIGAGAVITALQIILKKVGVA